MYKHLFGPVPSRRLGMSLGIDLVPKKVCSLDCVYCEVGKTTKHTTDPKEYILLDRVKEEVTDYFKNNPDPDYITFSGAGEPTLNSKIGDVLKFVKKLKPHIPVALITNGTLFYKKEVRDNLLDVDVVLPSLDGASQNIFEKINRPSSDIKIQDYIDGLIKFREEFHGKMWLEVFLLPGYNMGIDSLEDIKAAAIKIKPDSIQLNTLDRPGTVQGLRGASHEDLQEVMKFFEKDTDLKVEIISAAPKRKNMKAYRSDVASVIYETINRRPCTLEDLSKILGLHINELNKYFPVLESEGKIETIDEYRGTFYRLKEKE